MPRHRSCCGETGQLYPTIPHTPFRVQCPPLQLSHKGEKGWKILLGCSPRPYTPYSDKFPKDILRLGSRDCSVASREDVSHGSFHSGSKPQQSFAPEDKAGFAHYSSCAQVECRGTRERHPNQRAGWPPASVPLEDSIHREGTRLWSQRTRHLQITTSISLVWLEAQL